MWKFLPRTGSKGLETEIQVQPCKIYVLQLIVFLFFSFPWRIEGQKSCQKVEELDSFYVSQNDNKRAASFLLMTNKPMNGLQTHFVSDSEIHFFVYP